MCLLQHLWLCIGSSLHALCNGNSSRMLVEGASANLVAVLAKLQWIESLWVRPGLPLASIEALPIPCRSLLPGTCRQFPLGQLQTAAPCPCALQGSHTLYQGVQPVGGSIRRCCLWMQHLHSVHSSHVPGVKTDKLQISLRIAVLSNFRPFIAIGWISGFGV